MAGFLWLNPPAPQPPGDKQKQQAKNNNDKDKADDKDDKDKKDPEPLKQPPDKKPDDKDIPDQPKDDEKKTLPTEDKFPQLRRTLGSVDYASGYRHLWTFTSRGAAVERIELSNPAYRDLEDKRGYLGHLMLVDQPDGGCRIRVVGGGTPTAKAISVNEREAVGLRVNDVIQSVNGAAIANIKAFQNFMKATKPGDEIKLGIARRSDNSDKPKKLTFKTKLTHRPLEMVRPEFQVEGNPKTQHPLSFLLSLKGADENQRSPLLDKYLHDGNWELLTSDSKQVAFRMPVDDRLLQEIGQSGSLEIIKRYRLSATPKKEIDNNNFKAYHLDVEIEIRKVGNDDSTPQVAYQLEGPNGLPVEGWWYTNKIHPSKFAAMGARDILWKSNGQKHSMIGCPGIFKEATAKEPADTLLFTKKNPTLYTDEIRTLSYLGVDAQYFSAILMPKKTKTQPAYVFDAAIAKPVVQVSKKEVGRNVKKVNVSFQLTSAVEKITADKPLRHSFQFFAGPKERELLEEYELQQCISYGWFAIVSKPLVKILHFFGMTGNYGLAIILLTILVRGCMTPLSRKAAKNMQVTQALAPEMKKIKEKYKTDMQKQGEATRELYRKHKFNPFGGCWMMFIQLPIFLGLYRGLSTDIGLRGQSLIPGIHWCSNLAAPDQLWYWKPYLWDYFAGEATGWLGPYLNVLPLVTVALFVVQQKMFTPPPADEQAAMQQKMMKFMMLFMGVLFFKVASGLCIYFITSSIWGIVERKMLPKPQVQGDAADGKGQSATSGSSNGSTRKVRQKKNQKRR